MLELISDKYCYQNAIIYPTQIDVMNEVKQSMLAHFLFKKSQSNAEKFQQLAYS